MDGLDSPTVFRLGQPTLGPPTFALDYRSSATLPAEPVYPEPPSPSDGRLARLEHHLTRLESRLRAVEVPPDLAVLRAAFIALESRVHALEHQLPWYRRLARWLRAIWESI
jgi:hypothetical protein